MVTFSILTSVYNKEKYINQCISSVLNQANKDFEYIILDDGSTDMSPKIIDELTKGNKLCKVIHRENRGFSSTMEELFSLATGKYIINLDGDDWLEVNAIEEIAKILNKCKSEPDIIDFKSNFVNENGIEFKKEYIDYKEEFITENLSLFYKKANFIPFITYTRKAIKSSFLKNIKILNPPYACDRYMMVEINSKIHSYYYAELYLYNIRFQTNTLSASYNKNSEYYLTDLNRIYSTLINIEQSITDSYFSPLHFLFNIFVDTGSLRNVKNTSLRKKVSKFFIKYKNSFCLTKKDKMKVFMFCKMPHIASKLFEFYWKKTSAR